MLKPGVLFLCFFLVVSACCGFAADDYFPIEQKLIENCRSNFSSGCAKQLAEIRFNQARQLFVYLQQTDNMDALELALAYAESAVELDPKNSRNWSQLGEFYRLLPQDDFQVMAEGAFRKAIAFDHSNNSARLLLAELMFSQGRFAASTQLLLDVFTRDKTLFTHELAEMLALAYLLDNNAQQGLDTFRELAERHDQAFVTDFVAVFEEAI